MTSDVGCEQKLVAGAAVPPCSTQQHLIRRAYSAPYVKETRTSRDLTSNGLCARCADKRNKVPTVEPDSAHAGKYTNGAI